ncbi:probable U3 small nucleolar RNA-associated protein 11 [Lineus longissimus]|uniref:probable U3 small nucleolar RNA-associated protein 11 n=1 Tax=Lineus longissimus TaxID=88925 RepID=UPI002B4D70D5
MSTFKNAAKSRQKTHRERSQPSSRAHLGILEKKKDYKTRALDFQKKQSTLKALKRKALDRNPDEFYFKMVKTKLKDGVHHCEDDNPIYTDDQLKLMAGQDIKYIKYKATTEMRKISKLKSTLHMLDGDRKPKNKHTFFVNSKKEVSTFDPAKHLGTHPTSLDRIYNRPTKDTLKKQEFDAEILQKSAWKRRQKYKELSTRVEREKVLKITSRKMEMQTHLMDKLSKRTLVKDESKESAAVYQWEQRRKK